MCHAFADNGHEVILLAPDKKKSYEKKVKDIYEYYGVKKNFTIKKLWYPNIKGGAFFYTLAIFFYLIINKNFNLVYGRFIYGCYIASLLKNETIYESHAPIYEETKYGLRFFNQLVKSRYFKKLVVISQVLKDIYLENGFLNNGKIQVAHDGADEVLNFNSTIDLLGDINKFKVGYVGHLYKGKGIEIVASIAGKVKHDVEFHIIGGNEQDINIWKKSINNRNVFFYGHVPHKEVSNYINALDVCLLPNQKVIFASGAKSTGMNLSKFTSPLKVFEYMSHKKPIIASNLPVLKEVLNEKNSILVNCDNITEWINAIEKLKSPQNRDMIANQALCDFNNYTWKNRVLRLMNNI
jgi:glycosyltransferase involved in cell wall biosynthesis